MNYLLPRKDSRFPEQLFKIRKSLGMGFDQFATFTKVPKSCIARYEKSNENKKCEPNQKTWNKIRDSLNAIAYFTDEKYAIEIAAEKIKTVNEDVVKIKPIHKPNIGTFWQPAKP